jgi:hypothetical protein
MAEDLTRFGGRALHRATGRITAPSLLTALGDDEITWNFGVQPKTPAVDRTIRSKLSLHARFPALAGKWDGITSVNHWNSVVKVLGDKAEELIQNQPRGTCGGRAGSGAIDFVQCVMIAAGKRAKFHRASHAAVYFMARKLYGMLSGRWDNDNEDGVASGSVPEALSKLGVVQREEDGDANWYGEGSDDLACKLGAGLFPDIQAKILAAAKDNVVTEWTPVANAQELADGIASGGIGIGSDDQGFTMSRDAEGCCRMSGSWAHYQIRVGIEVLPSGRKVFPYWQSWGKNQPSGTRLKNYPGNVFGVDFNDQDRIIKSGDWAVVFGFPLWDLEAGNTDIPWSFANI